MWNVVLLFLLIVLATILAVVIINFLKSSSRPVIKGGGKLKRQILIWDLQHSYSATEIIEYISSVDAEVVCLQNCKQENSICERLDGMYKHMARFEDNVIYSNLDITDQMQSRVTISGISIYNIGDTSVDMEEISRIIGYDKHPKLIIVNPDKVLDYTDLQKIISGIYKLGPLKLKKVTAKNPEINNTVPLVFNF